MKISANITLFGNCKPAIEFYKSALDAKLISYITFQECKDLASLDLSSDKQKYVYRAELLIGTGDNKFSMIMGDSPSLVFDVGDSSNPNSRDNLTFHLECESSDLATKIYNSLLDGGKRNTPMEKRSDGSCMSGSLIDQYGVCWIITG